MPITLFVHRDSYECPPSAIIVVSTVSCFSLTKFAQRRTLSTKDISRRSLDSSISEMYQTSCAKRKGAKTFRCHSARTRCSYARFGAIRKSGLYIVAFYDAHSATACVSRGRCSVFNFVASIFRAYQRRMSNVFL